MYSSLTVLTDKRILLATDRMDAVKGRLMESIGCFDTVLNTTFPMYFSGKSLPAVDISIKRNTLKCGRETACPASADSH
ncbi:hypothetical protein ACMFMF_011960 [Clarireedia jacksonii]